MCVCVYEDALSLFQVSAGEAYTARNTSVYLFPAKVGHSYSCRSDSLYMGNGLYLDVSNDKMQAFNLTKNDVGTRKCPCEERLVTEALLEPGISVHLEHLCISISLLFPCS